MIRETDVRAGVRMDGRMGVRLVVEHLTTFLTVGVGVVAEGPMAGVSACHVGMVLSTALANDSSSAKVD